MRSWAPARLRCRSFCANYIQSLPPRHRLLPLSATAAMLAGWASGWSTRLRLVTRPCSSSMTMVLTGSLRPRAAGAASRAQTPLPSVFRFRMDGSFPPICRPQRSRLARSKEPSALGWQFRRIACRTPPARPHATRRRCPRSRQEQFFLWAALRDTKGLRCPFSSIFLWPACRVVRRRQPRRAPRARIV